jgi:hypothetical protein
MTSEGISVLKFCFTFFPVSLSGGEENNRDAPSNGE